MMKALAAFSLAGFALALFAAPVAANDTGGKKTHLKTGIVLISMRPGRKKFTPPTCSNTIEVAQDGHGDNVSGYTVVSLDSDRHYLLYMPSSPAEIIHHVGCEDNDPRTTDGIYFDGSTWYIESSVNCHTLSDNRHLLEVPGYRTVILTARDVLYKANRHRASCSTSAPK